MRGGTGWIEAGWCLTASSSSDPLHVAMGLYRQRWDDVKFPRDATALWALDQPPAAAVAGPAIADTVPSHTTAPVDRAAQRTPRSDAKRPEIAQAVVALSASPDWQAASSNKQRCRMVERHLDKPAGWCSLRTFGRAAK